MTTQPVNQTVNPVSNMVIEKPTQKARPEQSGTMQNAQTGRDSVEISIPAHVRLLKQQGFSVGEIAFKLRLDIGTVDQYLQPNRV